jgi:ABC transport system ATP-binding/permease protein
MPPILHLQDIHYTLGGAPLLDGAELAVAPGDRVCLVGRNGSGKSTLLRIAAGLLPAQGGTVFLQPGTTVRYLPQEPDFAGFGSTLSYVEAGLGPADDPHRAVSLLHRLGLDGTENPAALSGGEARRAALARTLAPAPDLLLLDEPTNHLDLPAIEWLEAELAAVRGALVLISHDRRLLERSGRTVVWLDRGRTQQTDRGFGQFEAWRDEVLTAEETTQHKLARQIMREEHWVRYGVTGRRKRNVRRVAELAALRDAKRTHVKAVGLAKLEAAEAEGSGKLVSVAKDVGKSYGGRVIVGGFSARIVRGDRVGIVGPNGAGKTTLLRLLTGALAPDSGEVRVGTNLQVVSLDQTRASLDPARTLQETLTGGSGEMIDVRGERRHVIGYMKDFLFRPEQARTSVGVLSGGERGRLMLAVALAKPSNLMILDEPTNDLDLETLDLLQDMLADYAGTVLLVSHDRDFLDRVVTSTIAAEGDGRWIEYAGGYADMLAQRGEAVPVSTKASGGKGRGVLQQTSVQKPAAPAPGKKFTFKDQHALKTLPGEIARLHASIAAHQAVLADAGLFTRDQKRFAAVSAALAKDAAALAAAEERWLELEMLREAVEG